MITNLLNELEDPQIDAAVRLLGERGLGVTVVHAHDQKSDEMCVLPEGMVQFEDDLRVSFVSEDDPVLASATPVAAAWINGKKRVIGRCRQGHGRML